MVGGLRAAVAAFCIWASAMPASAADLLLSYRFATTGKTASIGLSGSLASDGNTFVVTAFNSYAVDGTPTAIGPFFDSADRALGAPGAGAKLPTVTLDGSYLDFIIDNGIQGEFVLSAGNFLADYYGSQTGYYGGAVGAQTYAGGNGPGARNGYEDFALANYRAVLVTTGVPEPTTWTMLIVGFGMVGGTLRRRRTIASAISYPAIG